MNVHSSQLRTPLRTIVFSVMSTLYELVWLTNLEMTLDRNARRMRLSRFPPRRVQSNTAQCRVWCLAYCQNRWSAVKELEGTLPMPIVASEIV